MTYDQRCEDLAVIFLKDSGLDQPEHREALAMDIQRTIEDYIEYQKGLAMEDTRRREQA